CNLQGSRRVIVERIPEGCGIPPGTMLTSGGVNAGRCHHLPATSPALGPARSSRASAAAGSRRRRLYHWHHFSFEPPVVEVRATGQAVVAVIWRSAATGAASQKTNPLSTVGRSR